MTFARRALFFVTAGLTACSLLVDTDGLSGGVVSPSPSPDTDADATTAKSEPIDAGRDVLDAEAGRSFPDAAIVWTNGHGYETVHAEDLTLTWDVAKSLAEGRGGHLVTITSAEENVFVWSLVLATNPRIQAGDGSGPWIGGYQPPGQTEPGGGWTWVTGEPWSFATWNDGEPNNGGTGSAESALGYIGGNATWADYPEDLGFGAGYIVEYEP